MNYKNFNIKCRKQEEKCYYTYLIRELSIPITWLLHKLKLTANQATLLQVIITIIGGVFLFKGYFIIGLLAFNIAYLFDAIDGNLARFNNEFNLDGLHLDQINHHISPKIMYAGISFGLYMTIKDPIILIFGFLAVIFSTSVVMDSLYRTIFMIIRPQKLYYPKTLKEENIALPFNPPYDILILFIGAIINLKILMILFFLYSIIFILIQMASTYINIKNKTILKYL